MQKAIGTQPACLPLPPGRAATFGLIFYFLCLVDWAKKASEAASCATWLILTFSASVLRVSGQFGRSVSSGRNGQGFPAAFSSAPGGSVHLPCRTLPHLQCLLSLGVAWGSRGNISAPYPLWNVPMVPPPSAPNTSASRMIYLRWLSLGGPSELCGLSSLYLHHPRPLGTNPLFPPPVPLPCSCSSFSFTWQLQGG